MLTYTGNQGDVIATFSEKRGAVAQYSIGKGKIVDVATLLAYGYSLTNDEENLRFIKKVVGAPDSKFAYLPEGVRADEVYSNGKGFVVIDNTTNRDVVISLPYEICETVGNCHLDGDKIVVDKNKME